MLYPVLINHAGAAKYAVACSAPPNLGPGGRINCIQHPIVITKIQQAIRQHRACINICLVNPLFVGRRRLASSQRRIE